jgi:hypothetical protein
MGNEEQFRRPHGDEGVGAAMSLAHSVKFRLGKYATFHNSAPRRDRSFKAVLDAGAPACEKRP